MWTEKGDGLSVLKGTDERTLRDKRYAVLGFTGFGGASGPQKVTYDPTSDKSFPEGLTISPNRNPQWTEDLQAITFGIHPPRKRDGVEPADADATREGSARGPQRQGRPADAANAANLTRRSTSCCGTGSIKPAAVAAGSPRDGRSQLQLSRRVSDPTETFIRLADDDVRP